MALNVTIVCGNPKPRSRTLKVAESVVGEVLLERRVDLRVVDLVDHADDLLKWPSEIMNELTGRVARSDIAVFASPTYKATYTGLLKLFLDRYPANGLRDVTSICVMTGADPSHSLAPTVHLAPLLMELGAIVPVGGLYFNTSHMDRLPDFASANGARIRSTLARLASVDTALASSASEPASEKETA